MSTTQLACISHHLTAEARDKAASTSLRLLAALNVQSSTLPRAKRLAPRTDSLLTHSASPRSEKCRLGRDRDGRSLSSPENGITLIEMLVTLAIIALIVSIAYPSMTTGIDGIRLRTSVDNIAAFFSEARNMSDRFQTPVQITVVPGQDRLQAATIDGVWQNSYQLPDRVHITIPAETGMVVLFPGSPMPGLRMLLRAEHGGSSGLRFNIFTGVAEKWEPDQLRPEI